MDETNANLDAALKAIKHYNDLVGKGKKSDKKGEDKKGDDKKQKKVSETELTTFSDWKNNRNLNISVISTGLPELDEASGIGGFPRGKMVELFGTESGGKSYTAYKTIASCQKAGGVAALLDLENSFTDEWARVIGIDLNSLIYKNASLSAEQYLQIACDLCSGGLVDLVVIDSTAALIPQAELDGNIGDQTMALQARVLGPAVRKIMAAAAMPGKGGKETCVIWINQIREKPGVMYGNPEVTPGGKALKFYCHMRVDVRKKEVLYITKGEDKIPIGQVSRGTFVKNKVASPFKKFEFKISFESSYTNPLVMLADMAKENKLFYKSKGAYKYQPEDEKADGVVTGATDFILLAKWIYEQKKAVEIVGRLTDIFVETEVDIPEFFEAIDENTKPPLPAKDDIPPVTDDPICEEEEDEKE
jgi:recombination protein RecA